MRAGGARRAGAGEWEGEREGGHTARGARRGGGVRARARERPRPRGVGAQGGGGKGPTPRLRGPLRRSSAPHPPIRPASLALARAPWPESEGNRGGARYGGVRVQALAALLGKQAQQ